MKMNGEGRQKLGRKKFLAVGKACMAIFRPTSGFKGKIFELLVLKGWVFNFCVRSTLLHGRRRRRRTAIARAITMKTTAAAFIITIAIILILILLINIINDNYYYS